VKEPGRLDLAHIFLRTEAPPHAQRPRRGAHRTGASAPWGVFGRPSGNARRLSRDGRFRSRWSTKRHPPLTVLLVLAIRHQKKNPGTFRCCLLLHRRRRAITAGRPGIDTERKAFSFVIQVTNGTGQSGSSPPRPFGVKPGRPLSYLDQRRPQPRRAVADWCKASSHDWRRPPRARLWLQKKPR
jgi:hypothetical protein